MSNFYKSKTGIFVAGAYILVVVYSLIDYATSPPASMFGLALMFLTAPFSFVFSLVGTFFGDYFGFLTTEPSSEVMNKIIGFTSIVLGALLNTAILFLIGCSIANIYTNVSSKNVLDERSSEDRDPLP